MATDSTTTSTDGTTPTAGQDSTTTTTPATGGQVGQVPVAIDDSTQLPETHPLVKANLKYKGDLAAQKTELAEARAKAAQATKLEEDLSKRPTPEALATLQKRSDRLEGFLQAVGGPLGRALDSRSFTRDLFESDKDISDIVKEWNRANPSTTSSALGAGAVAPASGKPGMNDLLRAAVKS
jgi:hypothetical protein